MAACLLWREGHFSCKAFANPQDNTNMQLLSRYDAYHVSMLTFAGVYCPEGATR